MARISPTEDGSTRSLVERLQPEPPRSRNKVAIPGTLAGRMGTTEVSSRWCVRHLRCARDVSSWRNTGCAFGRRLLWKRSAHRNREGYVSKGADGRAIHRVKGHRGSDDSSHAGREMRRARMALGTTCRLEATGLATGERSDTETVTLRDVLGTSPDFSERMSQVASAGSDYWPGTLFMYLPYTFHV